MRLYTYRTLAISAYFTTLCFLLSNLNGATAQTHSVTRGPLFVSMADTLVGWAAGLVQTGGTIDNGKSAIHKPLWVPMILKTTDGGKRWRLQTVLQNGGRHFTVQSVNAVDSAHCRIILSDDVQEKTIILMTNDGERWSVQDFASADLQPKTLRFTDSLNGLLIAGDIFEDDQLLKTTDGGKTWQPSGLNIQGRLFYVEYLDEQIWVVAQTKVNPDGISLYRSSDKGKTWILVTAFNPPENERYSPYGFQTSTREMALIIHQTGDDDPGEGKAVMIYSSDRFLSHELFTVQYIDQGRNGVNYLSFPIIDFPQIKAFSRQGSKDISVNMSDEDFYTIIQTKDHGKQWEKLNEVRSSIGDVRMIKPRHYILASGSGTLLYTGDGGSQWSDASVDFMGLYIPPGPILGSGLSGLDEDVIGEDVEDYSAIDTIITSKWESIEDSLSAVNSSGLAKAEKYRPDITAPFSVGIDSVLSTTIQFHRRVRWGAKHAPWDLIKEEIKTGEIRIPRYKTIYLKGAVFAQNGVQAKKYLWTSSINGELSDKLSFRTCPEQLTPGTHFLFFKAMDPSGNWTKPVVIKIIVEDFPVYKFPFYGRWTVGGGGSYYNRGRHTKGIRYALDLNYAEGSDGGDNDFGIPVRASTDGIVTFVGYTKGYGRNVRISYQYAGKVYTTLVSHLSTMSVEVGEKVKMGQELGTCGSTGRSSAPHIHWELRVNDVCVPPEPIFENDSTILQTIRDGELVESDNIYQPSHIIVVDEPDIPGTWLEYKGYNHSFRWCGISKQKTVEAKWKPKLPRSGLYKVQVHIPRDHASAVATYRIHSKNGVQEVKINQNKYTWDWATLGVFEFDRNDDVFVALDNSSAMRKGAITFDAVRFIGLWTDDK